MPQLSGRRRFVPFGSDGITEEDAKQYLPPGARISKDALRENRWRVRSAELGGERTKSFGSKSTTSDWEALVFVVRLAWAAYTGRHGGACPFDFADA